MYSHKISLRWQLMLGFIFLVFLPFVFAILMWQTGYKDLSIVNIFVASRIFSGYFIEQTTGKIQVAFKLFLPVICLIGAFYLYSTDPDLAITCFGYAALAFIMIFVKNKRIKFSLIILFIILILWLIFGYPLE